MDGRLLPVNTVTCVRCGAAIEPKHADYTVDGLACSSCVLKAEVATRLGVANVGSDAIVDAEIAFTQSTARKHYIIGLVLLVIGIATLPIVYFSITNGVVSRALVLPVIAIGSAVTELARGFRTSSSIDQIRNRRH